MRILQIYKDYPPVLGGIELNMRDLCEGLAARGHQVTALVTAQGGRTSVERPLPGLPNLMVVRAARALAAASTPLSPAMLGLARAARADVVHLHFPYPPGDLAAMAAPGRPPLVVTYHSDIVRQRALLQLYRPLLARTLRRAARIIATNQSYIETSPFLRPHAAKCRVMPSAVDTRRFTPAGPGLAQDAPALAAGLLDAPRPWSLFVGRLRYYKGLHHLLAAMPQVPGTLLVAGSGPEGERLRAQAAGLAGRVRFLGDVREEEKPALYRAADVFVLPAHLRAEAFGLVLVEALASGLPCVSTELGTGTSFVNRHGLTGLVVPPADPPALARALAALLGDEGLRRVYGAAARERAVALFSREAMLDTAERVYAEAVSSQ